MESINKVGYFKYRGNNILKGIVKNKVFRYQSIKVIEDSDKVKIVTLSEGGYQTLLSLIPKDVFK